ncbi:MAG: hypothetical protein GX637_02220 [Clostridiales bacterium]|nr:hypothetical protein [Clostridiales bacterium]
MNHQNDSMRMLAKLLFRLLPIQILLAAVGAVNGIVSSFFASNYVGIDAMSAVGLFSPIYMLITSISTMLMGGSVILCGKYMGQNQQEKLQNVFSLDLAVSSLIAAVFTAAFLVLALFDLNGFMTQNAAVRALYNRYMLGQAIGVFPLILGNQLSAFLSMENKSRQTMIASLVYIAVNLALNFLFVQVLHLEAFGLALASSLGMWVFLAVQAQCFLAGKAQLKISVSKLRWRETGEIIRVGLPGALSNIYQTARGLIVNLLLELFVGTVGISAFATADNLLRIFWAVPGAMLAVSRMMISVSIGEEDRQTLTDVMRVMFRRFLPLMGVISAGIILCAGPLTHLFYRDAADPVYAMTLWGLRILPLCMPLSIICMHFVCYGQASGKQGLVHVLSLLDGVVCVAGFTAILIRLLGMNSVYVANILNGIVCALVILGYSWIKNRRLPRSMDELMVVPEDFGAPESERMDLTIRSMEEVVTISQQVQRFCEEKGIDPRRAYLSGLAMEEMAGNIVDHGFTKDQKAHSIEARVVHKDDDVILRLKDDCIPFNPSERQQLAAGDDPVKNIGIRMVFGMAREVQYQNILGLNVLSIRI